MRIEIDFSDLTAVPLGCWVTLAAVGYFMLAGLLLRLAPKSWGTSSPDDRFFLWLFSPMILSLVVFSYAVITAAWLASLGYTLAPWRFRGPFSE